MASFLIVYTNEVGKRLYTLERYIARYLHRFLLPFFLSNASKHQKRVVIGSTNKKPFTAKEKHSQRKYAKALLSPLKNNAITPQSHCFCPSIATLLRTHRSTLIHKALSQHNKVGQQIGKESIFFAVSFYFSIFALIK